MKRHTKHELIAQCANRGLTKVQTYNELKPLVLEQMEPMVFKANPEIKGGRRIPKPMHEQLMMLKNQIGRSYQLLGRAKDSDFESEEIPADDFESEESETEDEEIPETETETEDEETEDEDEVKPTAKGKRRVQTELEYFETRMREIRSKCEERERLGETLDDLSTMRPEQAASKLIPAGIPTDALLASMTMHWPDDAKSDFGISAFDFESLSREIMSDRGITGVNGEPAHAMFGYVLILAECRQPIYLVGPKGTGKSHLAEQLADYLFPGHEGSKYGEAPMTPGATRGDLLGRPTIAGLDSVIAAAALGDLDALTRILQSGGAGFILSEFCEIYSGGGVFNFEEIDAADASMLIVLNNALARKRLFNTANGQRYDKSEEFVAIATANTLGLGANRQYVGRERLDDATIDRWRMGRVWLYRDEKVASDILYGRV